MYTNTTASVYSSWTNYNYTQTYDLTGNCTVIPSTHYTEITCDTTALPIGGLINVNIRYQDGTSYTTAGYAAYAGTSTALRLYPQYSNTTNPTYHLWYDTAGSFIKLATPAERLKETLRMRVAPRIYTHAKPLGFTKDLREIRARETLHRVLGEEKYKAFLRKGFISVMAKSGLVYQIFPGYDFTKVYDRGVMIDRYCVVLQGNFPPTDSLIMRYLMVLNNEQQFKSFAVKHGVGYHPAEIEIAQDNRSLLEIFKEYKKAA
jgi:hypothetical protein